MVRRAQPNLGPAITAGAVFLAVVGLGWVLGRAFGPEDPIGVSNAVTTGPAAASATDDDTLPPLLTGQVVVAGAELLNPLSIAVATKYLDRQPLVAVEVTGIDFGLDAFCDRALSIDIGQSDAPITAEEANTCAASGIEYVELVVANDSMSGDDLYLYVNRGRAVDNDAVRDFVDFYLGHGLAQTAAEAGQRPPADTTLAITTARWQNALPPSS